MYKEKLCDYLKFKEPEAAQLNCYPDSFRSVSLSPLRDSYNTFIRFIL